MSSFGKISTRLRCQLAVPLFGAILTLGCGSGAASEPNGSSARKAGNGSAESNQANDDQSAAEPSASVKRPRVVGYLPTYKFAEKPALHLETLTHLNIAFAIPNDEGKVEFAGADPNTIRDIVERAHAAKVKVLVALAGYTGSQQTSDWLDKDFDRVVDSLLELVDEYHFDGVDVDIEGENIRSKTYGPLMRTLSKRLAEFPERKLLTAAVAEYMKENYAALGTVDFLNIMSYDQCGEWSDACEHAPIEQARDYLRYWSNFRDVDANGEPRTIGAENVVLGVPFYGRCWGEKCPDRVKKPDNPDGTPSNEYYKTTELSYGKILAYCANQTLSGCSPTADILSSGDSVTGYYVSLNSPATITKKTVEAKSHGGIMIWELAQDDRSAPLFAQIAEAFPKSSDDSEL